MDEIVFVIKAFRNDGGLDKNTASVIRKIDRILISAGFEPAELADENAKKTFEFTIRPFNEGECK